MKDRWTVIKRKVGEMQSGTPLMLREYVYGDVSSEFTEEEMKNIEVVPYEKWTANDFVEILRMELESANYHNFTDVPNVILQAIRKHWVGEVIEDKLMRYICESIYEVI